MDSFSFHDSLVKEILLGNSSSEIMRLNVSKSTEEAPELSLYWGLSDTAHILLVCPEQLFSLNEL